MFSFDISYVPATETAVANVSAYAVATNEPTGKMQITLGANPNFVIFDCQQVENREDSDSRSADRSIDPAGTVRNMFNIKDNSIIESTIRVQLLQEPKHGKLRAEIANTGYRFFAYDPAPGFLGKDEVVFIISLGSKTYKVVSTLQVVRIANEREDQTLCPAPQSVKVSTSVMSDFQMFGTTSLPIEGTTGAKSRLTLQSSLLRTNKHK